MAKSNVYTRTGDLGTTSLTDGSRIAKDASRLQAYGTIDELSSTLGKVAAGDKTPIEISTQIKNIQNKLFNIGGYLASPAQSGFPTGVNESDIPKLENWIDAIDEQLPAIRAFILPGGTVEAADAHIARTVCRRAERAVISLSAEEEVDPIIIKYINRLSDYLFIAARFINFTNKIEETIWDKDA